MGTDADCAATLHAARRAAAQHQHRGNHISDRRIVIGNIVAGNTAETTSGGTRNMAVRLRGVSITDSDPTVNTAGWSDVVRPSERFVGGRISDKVGSRMGLRPATKRRLSEDSAVALFDSLQASPPRESCSR